jgi:hypothetical protein
VFVEILLKPLKPILARTVANQTGVIPAASFQSATATNHPLLVGKPQARLIKMAKLTTPLLQKESDSPRQTRYWEYPARDGSPLVRVCDSMMVKVASLTGIKSAGVSIRSKLAGW